MASRPAYKYSPEVVKRITDGIALGAARCHASAYGGITLNCLNMWEKRYPEFKQAMLEAEGRGVIGWLAKMEKAANDGDWRAAESKLKMRFPEQYNRSLNENRNTGADGGPIEIEHRIIPASIASFRATLEVLGLSAPVADVRALLPEHTDDETDVIPRATAS